MFIKKYKTALLAFSLVFLSVSDLFAINVFNYTGSDVLIGFRKSGGGGTNLVVDCNHTISFYTNLPANTRTNITTFTGAQLAQVATNNMNWSAFACNYVNGNQAASVVYITKFRSGGYTTQTTPYKTFSAAGLYNLITSGFQPIIQGASDNATYSSLNTSTAILEPDSFNQNNSDLSYDVAVNFDGSPDFNGTFGKFVEGLTPSNFTTSGQPQRADFYWMAPGSGNAVFLGYFELNTNGAMAYVAFPTPTPATPVITSITRTNTISYITFTSGSAGTYTLRGTNSVGLVTAARTNWPAISSTPGNNSTQTLMDTNALGAGFYVITAQ